VKLLLENLPPSLAHRRKALADCLEAIGRTGKIRAVYLFGSHARGEARSDSDVDLCVVADDAERQLPAAARWRKAMRAVWPRPAFTLVPISPARLVEKRARQDHFFATVLNEGVLLATEN
jgi:predicted nucleotidyltransferase